MNEYLYRIEIRTLENGTQTFRVQRRYDCWLSLWHNTYQININGEDYFVSQFGGVGDTFVNIEQAKTAIDSDIKYQNELAGRRVTKVGYMGYP